MKNFLTASLVVFLGWFSIARADVAPRRIEMHTEKVGEAIHWRPATVEVTQGEVIEFVVTHKVEGGFNFHGFQIAPLGIRKQIDRGTETIAEAKVPDALKTGEYEIGCHFHPKHVGAKLLVKAKNTAIPEAKADTKAAPAKPKKP